ncbi:MAG: hypothetical protein LC642_00500 [Verrucomicrobiaceae bacterium]|nr:hypothetical protein [Verrucomicrobiaceae bacterium]
MNFLLDDLWPDPPPPPNPRPVLPTIALGLHEIFVTDMDFNGEARLGDFMPVLCVDLLRRGQKKHRSTVFSLS